MKPLILVDSGADTPVERLLDTLGVLFERRSLTDALRTAADTGATRPALLLSEEQLANACGGGERPGPQLQALLSRYGPVLVYPFRGTVEGRRALAACSAGLVETAPIGRSAGPYVVANDFPAVGPFRGLRVRVADSTPDNRLWVRGSPYPVQTIVSVGNGALLSRVLLPTTELFVAASTAIFDVDGEHTRNLVVAECFSALAPLLFFLRHIGAAFWQTNHPTASVIIDDLNLRPRYGFVDAQTLVRHLDELGCAVSIGFIPWNWSRTAPGIVELFRRKWPRLSLCIHGCDHVGGEFSTSSRSAAASLIRLSLDRMERLAARTGLLYDKVMVFPQGRFSTHAMEALRQSDFVAAVNTELVDDRSGRGVRAAELLRPAITSHAGFPLFLRRKLDADIADFALDLLLGKPCLVVTHHDDYQRGMAPFVSVVRALGAIEPALTWTNLGAIVTGTYASRPNATGSVDVRLFAPATSVPPPPGTEGAPTRFLKAEFFAEGECEIVVDGQRVKGRRDGVDLVFTAALARKRSTIVDVTIPSRERPTAAVRPVRYRAKVAARRYLSEFRDNYVARSPWATTAVRMVRGSRLRTAAR